MVSIEPPEGASQVGDVPDADDDEKKKQDETLKRELAARQELADAMRLASALRVKNQEALLRVAREWADKLFNTRNMSGPELDDWTRDGIEIFGTEGERAAKEARARRTTRENGRAVSTDTGRVIARDRVSGFLFTADLFKPVVNTVDATEFAGLERAIETDPGDADGSPGEMIDAGPGDAISQIARQAREGGAVTTSTTAQAGQAPASVKQRAKHLKLSKKTQARIARTAEDFGEELETSDWLLKRGVTIEVPKITRPDITVSPDLENPPPLPSKPRGGSSSTAPTLNPATFNDDLSAPPSPALDGTNPLPTLESIQASAEAPVLFVFQGSSVPTQEEMAAALGKTLPENFEALRGQYSGDIAPPDV